MSAVAPSPYSMLDGDETERKPLVSETSVTWGLTAGSKDRFGVLEGVCPCGGVKDLKRYPWHVLR